MEARALELLASLSVTTLRSVRAEVGALSGGQRQSVAIARSLLGDPQVVILDEPTAALGVAQTHQVLQLVKRLRERGLGVIYISHNISDIFDVADRVIVLRLGRRVATFHTSEATPNEVVGAITGSRLTRHRPSGRERGDDMTTATPPPPVATGAPDAPETPRPTLTMRLAQLGSLRVAFVLALIWIIFQTQNDRFLTSFNLTNLVLQIAAVGTISIGIVLILLLGEIDLSVGAVSGLAAAVMAVLNVKHGWGPVPVDLRRPRDRRRDRPAQRLLRDALRDPLVRRDARRPARVAGRAAARARLDRHRQSQRPDDHRPDRHVLRRRLRLGHGRPHRRRLRRVGLPRARPARASGPRRRPTSPRS